MFSDGEQVTVSGLVGQRCAGFSQRFEAALKECGDIVHAGIDTVIGSCGNCGKLGGCSEMACTEGAIIAAVVDAMDTPPTPATARNIKCEGKGAKKIKVSLKTRLVEATFKRVMTQKRREAIIRRVLGRCGNCPDRFKCVDGVLNHVSHGHSLPVSVALVFANCKREYSWKIPIENNLTA